MTSAADAFNTGEGLIVLPPNETFSGEFGVYVK
jgi:galactose mutarotase-like enzyme